MILLNLLEGQDTDMIYLDFAKALDNNNNNNNNNGLIFH